MQPAFAATDAVTRVQLRVVPSPVPCGRYGTWQYDVELTNRGSGAIRITSVRWRLYRRDDGVAAGPELGPRQGRRNAASFFGTDVVAPGARVRARSATWSHWEAPYVVWHVSIADLTSGDVHELAARADLEPAPLVPFPYIPGQEAVLALPEGAGRHPALLILHPYGGSARAMAWAALEAARHGFAGLAISQPGFGNSVGPVDYAGPRSQQAALAAIDFLRAHPAVDAERIAVWGISLGAMLGGLLAANSRQVKAAVLQAGLYDLAWAVAQDATWADARPGRPRTADEIAVRDVLRHAADIRCPVLLLHGAQDQVAPPEHARRLARRLEELGRPVELVLFERYGHGLPPARVWRDHLLPFLLRLGVAKEPATWRATHATHEE